MPKLIVQQGGGRFREFELGRTNTIGRHPDQDIQVIDPLVSKEHLVLELLAGDWFLRDLDSRNGSWVNGERVRGRVRIQNNDRVKIGTTHMVFVNKDHKRSTDHTVTIGDSLESSIYGSIYRESAEEFLPVDLIPDEETLRNDYEKLRLASRLHHEIAFDVRLDALLTRVLDHLFGLFKADRGVILLSDGPDLPLHPRAVKVRGRVDVSESIALSQTIVNKVRTEGAAVLTRDAQMDDRFHKAQSVIIQGIRSTMCVPLLSRTSEVMGVIHLDSLLVANAFTEKDLGMLQAVAKQAAIAIENSRLVAQIEHEAITRQKFEKMLSPNLVERVVKGELEITKGGELRQVTVMFTDIRAFTELAERLPPQDVVKLLNEYFELLVDVIFDFDGTLDKFMGDSLMAIWGAPVEDPNQAQKAVQCAVEMQRSLQRFNTLRRLDGKLPIHTGIGVDMGECVLGYMGSSKTMSYTAIGSPVNLASRLCATARPGEILISEAAYAASQSVVRAAKRKPLMLKGISNPVPSWSVVAAHYMSIPTEERPIEDFGLTSDWPGE